MTFWIINIATVFILSCFFAGIVIPQILLIAFRRKLFDAVDERKIHTSLVPRLGGLAFKPVEFFSVMLLIGVNLASGHNEILADVGENACPLAFGFTSMVMLYLVGLADDLVGVRYRAKFVVQILCGIMLIAGGVYIDDLHGFMGVTRIPDYIGYPLTVVVVVFVINAINLIDGIDGLASGLSGVAFLLYGLVFFTDGAYFYSMISFAALGVLIPFYYYNVFGNPEKHKKIFMGDTGSLTIGMMICFLCITIAKSEQPAFAPNRIVVAFIPLLVPCFDVLRVFFLRIRTGKNPFLPDKSHIHHKLLAIGLSQREALVSIVVVSVALSVLNVMLSKTVNVTFLLLADLFLWTLANILLSKQIVKYRRKCEASEKEEK